MQIIAVILCPECGHRAMETMPIDACQHFYRCTSCGVTLRPLAGDCCVFCSYADTACPPMQAHDEGHDDDGHGRG